MRAVVGVWHCHVEGTAEAKDAYNATHWTHPCFRRRITRDAEASALDLSVVINVLGSVLLCVLLYVYTQHVQMHDDHCFSRGKLAIG